MIFNKIICTMLCTLLCFSCFNCHAFAEDVDSRSKYDYIELLETFNNKYSTSFCFDFDDHSIFESDETLSFYSKMSDEEFEQYFLDVKTNYENWLNTSCIYNENAVVLPIGAVDASCEYNINNVKSPNVPQSQNLYYTYSYNTNSVIMNSTVNFSSGWGIYLSIDSVGGHVQQFPAYLPTSTSAFSSSIYSNYGYSIAICDFYCRTYASPGVYVSGTDLTIRGTFTAGAGDIYSFSYI
ncbi:MAG: hypothetical protein K6G68_01970 [Oscillospiraceae bacterium]|nr:hypothetical protein [Oscillospiraceae bacterium]